MAEKKYIELEEVRDVLADEFGLTNDQEERIIGRINHRAKSITAADVRPVSEIEKIIESLQEQADIYNARAKELLVEEDGQVSQYTWAVSLRETYRRIIKTLDDLIS